MPLNWNFPAKIGPANREQVKAVSNHRVSWRYDERNREGDHICYISDMTKFRLHYPGWSLTRRVADTIEEMIRFELS